ncbi:hypothetical protein B484DRAFT_443882, partial [Ochromonadaceae sp. CCMP2298]|mmetsp:Transcript_16452/g.36419  ORF Transcript_16452/g.36419 Transcript_16452/m.36419 type:complete len:484 (-) Transcript_16452:167-1618(-)
MSESERSRLLPGGSSAEELPFLARLFSRLVSPDTEDDSVSLGVKKVGLALTVVVSLWLLSFLLVMVQIIEHETIGPRDFALFAPMWVGSLLGLVTVVMVSVNVCKSSTLVSRERRLFMRAQGTERQSEFIDYESLPLMRRLLCWNLALALSFLLILITQVLFSLWFISAAIGVWHALVPVLLLASLCLLYLCLMDVLSAMSCGVVVLVLLQLFLFTLKCSRHMLLTSWTLATLPLDVVLLYAYVHLAAVVLAALRGRYDLKPAQKWCLAAHAAALLLATLAEALTVMQEHAGLSISSTPAVLWTVVVTLLVLCLLVVVNAEVRVLAVNRGFLDPLPLSRTKDGWAPTPGGGKVYFLLLGGVALCLPSPATASHSATNADLVPPSSHSRGGKGVTFSDRARAGSGALAPIGAVGAVGAVTTAGSRADVPPIDFQQAGGSSISSAPGSSAGKANTSSAPATAADSMYGSLSTHESGIEMLGPSAV